MLKAAAIWVMTWNACAGTNSLCPLYGATASELAWNVVQRAGDAQVIFLQEFCTGADAALEGLLESRTGHGWSVRSVALTGADGRPYSCHPDRLGRARGTQSVTVAVADPAAAFRSYPLTSPPWYVKRYALCATLPSIKVRGCTSHLSVGWSLDDRQPGAPYRTKQVRELMAVADRPGYTTVFGGDFNLRPGAHALIPAYRAYQECDARRRATHANGKKLDYLFVRKGAVSACQVVKGAPSDHLPLVLKMAQ
ncbi:endonuclease/exonuclease/phosphatase family protein [Nonomuraea sediminis]|uniref:endonuclease/exonuclease/phosphatase family protein n=1 Tax=Nonomuraea sediminis TaxID=2835864 RepID=UPI001BDC4705|nr:endonuclease/exonuclease/phosphatase family protein [Nonomuraea sediminis]